MKTEDLFKYGVTRKGGRGERFKVCSIKPGSIEVCKWGEEDPTEEWSHGGYELWEQPKTLFEDDSIEPTWGNLKKAFEAMGLPDDTRFISDPTTFDMFTLLSPSRGYAARFRIVKHVGNDGDESKEIMVY